MWILQPYRVLSKSHFEMSAKRYSVQVFNASTSCSTIEKNDLEVSTNLSVFSFQQAVGGLG